MNGFLVLNKPRGPTSHDMVARIRRLIGRRTKVGHTGTLDPAASGVLPIAIGAATRLSDELRDADKAYCGIIDLGVVTDSDDAEGKVIAQQPIPPLDTEQLEQVLVRFRGHIAQLPPAFSAVHVAGQRAYELARRGQLPELALREVTVHQLTASLLNERQIAIAVRCSKGTYIRALARDIGAALGCGGHLSALQRTQAGPFSLAEAVELAQLQSADDVARHLQPPGRVLQDWARLELNEADAQRVSRGMPIRAELTAERAAAYRGQQLIALLERIGEHYQPRKVFDGERHHDD